MVTADLYWMPLKKLTLDGRRYESTVESLCLWDCGLVMKREGDTYKLHQHSRLYSAIICRSTCNNLQVWRSNA